MIEFLNRFITSLSDEELNYLHTALHREEEKRIAKARAQFGSSLPPLTDQEKEMVRHKHSFDPSLMDPSGKIQAVKAYRMRIGCSLREALTEVDSYLKSEFPNLYKSTD